MAGGPEQPHGGGHPSQAGAESADPADAATLTDRSARAEAFKAAMRMLPSGVVIVTTEIDDRPWGLTVNACCSISPFPPKLLVSLGRHTRTRGAILETGGFGVDVLRASQSGLADLCATPGVEKWIDEFCERRAEGFRAPAVGNALCHFDCEIDTVTEVSDHSLVIGRVEGTRVATDVEERGASPLLYFDRAFRDLGETLEGAPVRSLEAGGSPRPEPWQPGRTRARRVAVVGAGQAGLQLSFGLLEHGYDVTVYSDRTAADLLESRAPPAAAMFGRALSGERELGLNMWDDEAAWFEEVQLNFSDRPGAVLFGLRGRLDRPGQAVDQRLKFSAWMDELQRRGGTLRLHAASVEDLEELASDADLVVVATGRGELTALFDVDEELSMRSAQRALCLLVLHGAEAEADAASQMAFDFVADQGEVLWVPFLDKDLNTCRSILIEARPGTDFDRFGDLDDGEEALAALNELVSQHCPWQLESLRGARLAGPRAWARGALAPTVRGPVGHLPSGRVVMPAGDAAILNDPLGSQGANTAAKMAEFLIGRIVEHEGRPFNADWMEATLEEFWDQQGRYATGFTNTLLEPFESPAREILLAGARDQRVADWFMAGFDDPSRLWPALESAAEARRSLSRQTSRPWVATAAASRLALLSNRLRRWL